ncbi:VOC family protein [Nonomuraea sp. NPDC048916]|uniref:VOC family protein n=1 Tax=Nonomuraea sp. NPDC048916 TaxID=3154232 RepID=UPI00340DC312
MSLPGIVGLCHIGFAVHSIEEFQRTWGALLGLDDWLVRDVNQPDGLLQLHGEIVGPASSRVAFARLADTAIELVEPHDGRTRTSAWLEERGPGIHHLAFWVDDLDRAVAALGDTAEVTYSPAGRRPGLAAPVSAVARGHGALPLAPEPAPGFWAYTESRDARVPWCLELLDARSTDIVRAAFGDHLVYPPPHRPVPGDPLVEPQPPHVGDHLVHPPPHRPIPGDHLVHLRPHHAVPGDHLVEPRPPHEDRA